TLKKSLISFIENYFLGNKISLSIRNELRGQVKIFYKEVNLKPNQLGNLVNSDFRNRGNFPFEYEKGIDYIKFWKEKYPDDVRFTLERAEEIMNHKFTIFEKVLEFKDEIDWHKDPLTGKSWSKKYYKRIDYFSRRKISDIKYSWELNKHLHFVTLGKAYYYTKDNRYVEEFVKQVTSWIKQNPLEIGINWIGNIQIAQRILSWIISYHLFQDSNFFQSHHLEDFLKNIYSQMKILFKKRHIPNNNHRIAAICAILISGFVFPEFRMFSGWVEQGFDELKESLKEQVFEDGVDKEQTTSYEKAVIEFLLLTYIFAERNNINIPDDIVEIIHKMVNHFSYLMTPDNKIPIVGDNSNERGYTLSETVDFWNVETILIAGSVIFDDPYLKIKGIHYTAENFWLLGIQGYKRWESILPLKGRLKGSKGFRTGGHFVIRNSWGKKADYLFIRCGEFGFNVTCAHSHCDLLSIILYITGQPILVDSGVFRYNTSLEERDYYRRASAHNTIQIDSDEQCNMGEGMFICTSRISDARCQKFKDNYFKGFLITETGIKHSREISLIDQGHWIISDTIESEISSNNGIHTIKWFFKVSPYLKVTSERGGKTMHIRNDNINICLKPSIDANAYCQILQRYISTEYGRKEKVSMICFSLKSKLPTNAKFEFVQSERLCL
ncbi:MAG: alginate lyase family protein, partial [Desulfobacterales bacterium]|nr:alginate lyase family protein [Desulfobacterales bacterium]